MSSIKIVTNCQFLRHFATRAPPIRREFSFHPVLATYKVRDFLSKRQKKDPSMIAHCVNSKHSITEAVRNMRDKSALRSALLVKDEDSDELVGIITERDYARKVELLGKDPRIVTCQEIMTPQPKTISQDDSLDDAITVLFQGSFRHLPVMDSSSGKKKPVGILGINDTLRELFRLQVLHKYIPSVKAPLTSIQNGPSKDKLHLIKQDDSVFRAIQLMSEKDVGSLCVVDSKNVMVGIVTERDYVQKVSLPGHVAKNIKVAEIMTEDPITTRADMSILQGLELLVAQGFRHIPLIGESDSGPIHKETGDRVVAMLSSKHIIRYVYGL